MPKTGVLLLSGGLDSTTAGAIAREQGFSLLALTVSYGQRHAAELQAARRVGSLLGVKEHKELDVDLSAWGGSALTETGSASIASKRTPRLAAS